jgi:hypothetical protein
MLPATQDEIDHVTDYMRSQAADLEVTFDIFVVPSWKTGVPVQEALHLFREERHDA